PGHWTSAFGKQQVQQSVFAFINNRDVVGQGQFDRTSPQFFKGIAISPELVETRLPASERASLVADVLSNETGSESHRTSSDGFFNQRFDFSSFFRRRGAIHRLFTHHKVTEWCQWREKSKVDT